jgi:hypothetical protein
MIKSTKNTSLRDEFTPRPYDCDHSDPTIGGKRTPSDRALRAENRDALRAGYESVVNDNTKDTNCPLRRVPEVTEIDSKFNVHNSHRAKESFDKTQEENKQSTNLHSPPPVNPQVPESSSENDDFVPSDSGPLNHKTRNTNLTDFDASQSLKIKFPKSSDNAAWSELDKELNEALPRVFDDDLINSSTSTELSKKFDAWLAEFFIERCGTVPDGDVDPSDSTQRDGSSGSKKIFRHRGLERLRRRKRELHLAYKVLCLNNLQYTEAGRSIKKCWLDTMQKHNRLRIAVSKLKTARKAVAEQRSFKRDLHGYAGKLFKNTKNAAPTFSKETATKYFSETYRDEERGDFFHPPPGLDRPPLPEVIFQEHCPSLKELCRSVRKKSNGAAAGLNGLSYVPYKKCSSIMRTLHKITKKIYESKDIPEDWAQAFIVLLSKSDDLDDPSEFRPIAITNTVGKIFFSVISDRLQKFMVENDFIRKVTQKGFLSGVPGCLEHAFTLYEALRDAKEHQKQIVVAWIDLANAYGSVRHNLIQFALNWYHVPKSIQTLIFDYYNKLMAKVQSAGWSTGFFSV